VPWIGSKGVPRFAPPRRPFAGPLKASSQKQSLVILHGLFKGLISTGYTTANPFAGVRIQAAAREMAPSTVAADTAGLEQNRAKRNRMLARTLPTSAPKAVLDELPALEPGGRHRRTAFVLRFLLSTGLRIAELAAARRDHLEWIPPSQQGDAGWVLHAWWASAASIGKCCCRRSRCRHCSRTWRRGVCRPSWRTCRLVRTSSARWTTCSGIAAHPGRR
jgi:integrase